MSWLAPLGFLALLSIIVLIIIYIIKPNFQQKMVSSTFVWQLSLKYRKKRIPISKLSNILIFLCQLLILTTCALLLARPVIENELTGDDKERVIIIDASASMMLTDQVTGTTRFERAVSEAKLLVEETHEKGGSVSVILADSQPEFLAQRFGSDKSDEVIAVLDTLVSEGGGCTYGSSNIDGAITLTEEVLRYNNEAQIFFLTATNYIEKNGINVRDVSAETDWNAAILDAKAELNADNRYEITVNVGCFGRTELLTVYCEVHSPNGKSEKLLLNRTEFFDPAEPERKVVFTSDDMNGQTLYSFDSLEVYVSVDDSFADDNSFFIYGGKKPTIKIQYASSKPNNYFGGVVRTIRENMKNTWDVEFTELKADQKAATEGFDLYIFEHRMPSVMPTDGVVLLVDPSGEPEGAGIRFGSAYGVESSSTLASGNPHDLTKYTDSSRVTIAKYTEIIAQDGYTELAYYNGSPVMLAKNTDEQKVVVWAFDLNYSNLIALPDFSFLMYNMFNHYLPATMSSNYFEIGDVVDLTARGTELKVTGNKGEEFSFDKSGQITLTTPGTYTATQKPMEGDELIIENFFVKIPADESRITKQVDSLPVPDVETKVEIEFEDLMFYFALALVSLLFIEWALQTKKNF